MGGPEFVMPGLDPIRANLGASLPGSTRQSINLRKNFLAKKMDARVKPAHDRDGEPDPGIHPLRRNMS